MMNDARGSSTNNDEINMTGVGIADGAPRSW